MSVRVLTLLRSGPGSYDMFESGLAQLSFKQAFLARTKKGGFGSTVQRDFIFHNTELLKSPSPAQYEVRATIGTAFLPYAAIAVYSKMCLWVQAEKKTEERYKKQRTAVFRSATERLQPEAKVSPPLCFHCSQHFPQIRCQYVDQMVVF